MSCKLLSVLLAISPTDVLKLLTGQLLRSKSTLAVTMAKVRRFAEFEYVCALMCLFLMFIKSNCIL